MTVVVNEVRRGTYLDSVALMRLARELTGMPDVEEAGLMIGTPANRDILRDAGVLAAAGEAAGPGDLIVAVRAKTELAASAAIARAKERLEARRASSGIGDGGSAWQPRTLRSGIETMPDANLALISVPGVFAAAEARKALNRGLNVMIFSDNVALADEVALKREARERGLLLMGPDCGTAIISGLPLGFANAVPRGGIGIIGASGTGIQEVSCLVARAGHGISHAIGTGGRDLKAEVGGITTLMAIDLLEADPATKHIVLISKPPAEAVARAVLERVARAKKPFTICFLGADDLHLPRNAQAAVTLEAAALLAVGGHVPTATGSGSASAGRKGGTLCGLFSGGTLCAEAQVIAREQGVTVTSNAPITGVAKLAASGHTLIDLGDDEFTRGRPHPMLEPTVRDQPLLEAVARADVGVILVDVVLGFGSNLDPAGHLATVVAGLPKKPPIVASVTGTNADPQGFASQVAKLQAAGIEVAASNAAATRRALALIGVGG